MPEPFHLPSEQSVSKEFRQIVWDDQLRRDWMAIVRLAVAEDRTDAGDLTTKALVPENVVGTAAVVARAPGVVAGLPGVELILKEIDPRLRWSPAVDDGQPIRAGDRIGRIDGPAQGLLIAERLVLNVLGRLSGIATTTRWYVDQISGTNARVYDTRKTTPGWRRLEKYAVRCGGGSNHRTGLSDAVLIKDNHLALGAPLSSATGAAQFTPAEAVARAKRFIQTHASEAIRRQTIIEVEVDTLAQLEEVLPIGPDIVLLDNMRPDGLRAAVARRDALNPAVELEASGGVTLETVRPIAAAGVDRISLGALTHGAAWLDIALDWWCRDAAKG
ncbi:MAG: nicotinate-nucleotide diphosphorylase (carboxylating) [Planctomycetes bacterium RBG_13_63_9]|nr:MAG: nicotinate-nucleotide diphosphorylase (carboxylating) [Planctomycetes bacterium RBG_13_63_9]